jgi:methyltransferase (TIGR00027 family)
MGCKVSNTAYGVAKFRSFEMFFPPEKRLFDDPYSLRFLPIATRISMGLMHWTPIRDFFVWLTEIMFPGMLGGLVCRTRYIDDVVQRAVNDGVENVVNLGAGLDTRALRLKCLKSVKYYEVDQVELIQYKRRKIEKWLGVIPDHLHLVSVDFLNQKSEDRLSAEGLRSTEKTLFIMEGLIQYISTEAFHELLQMISRFPNDSYVVFTYPMQDLIDGSKDYGWISRLFSFSSRFMFSYNNGLLPETIHETLKPFSLDLIEDAGAAEYQKIFLVALDRKLNVFKIERIAYARLKRS